MMEEDQPGEFDLEVSMAERTAMCFRGKRSAHPGALLHVQAYIGNYSSHTKIDRLIFIAEKSAGQPLELEALKLAADELRQVGGGRRAGTPEGLPSEVDSSQHQGITAQCHEVHLQRWWPACVRQPANGPP